MDGIFSDRKRIKRETLACIDLLFNDKTKGLENYLVSIM